MIHDTSTFDRKRYYFEQVISNHNIKNNISKTSIDGCEWQQPRAIVLIFFPIPPPSLWTLKNSKYACATGTYTTIRKTGGMTLRRLGTRTVCEGMVAVTQIIGTSTARRTHCPSRSIAHPADDECRMRRAAAVNPWRHDTDDDDGTAVGR